MNCPNCGTSIKSGNKFCSNCGTNIEQENKFCQNCGANIIPGNNFCQNCGQSIENKINQNISAQTDINMNMSSITTEQTQTSNIQNNNSTNQVNVLLVIVSFFIPLVGMIIFLTTIKKAPKNAKACGISALASTIISIVLSLLIIVPIITAITNTIEDAENFQTEEIYDYNNNDNETTNNIVTDGEGSKNWKDYQVTFNGKVIKLPISYKDFSSTTGFQLKQAQSMSYLENKYYTLANLYKDEQLALYTEITNTTGKMAQYQDCNITRVSQTKYMTSKNVGTIIFPGGLKAGDQVTENQIIGLFGNPTDKKTYNSDNYNKITYIYNENTDWTTQNYYQIEIVNGVIDQITLDNR